MTAFLNWINAHAKGLAAGYGSAATALYPVYGHYTWFIWVIAGGAVLGVTGITNTKPSPSALAAAEPAKIAAPSAAPIPLPAGSTLTLPAPQAAPPAG
jgi:hypothetical protein